MRWLAAPIRCALRALAARGRRRRWLDQERDRQCALALSMRFGVVVERVAKHSPDVTRGHLLVWPQRGLPRESDPFAANHHVRSWADALARVRVYGALQPLVRRGGGTVGPRCAPVAPAAPVVDGASIAVPSRTSASAAGLGSLGSACASDLVDRHGLAGAQRCRALALLAHGFAAFADRRRVGWEARAFACAMLATLDSAGAVPRHVSRGAFLADIEDAAVAIHATRPELSVQA